MSHKVKVLRIEEEMVQTNREDPEVLFMVDIETVGIIRHTNPSDSTTTGVERLRFDRVENVTYQEYINENGERAIKTTNNSFYVDPKFRELFTLAENQIESLARYEKQLLTKALKEKNFWQRLWYVFSKKIL